MVYGAARVKEFYVDILYLDSIFFFIKSNESSLLAAIYCLYLASSALHFWSCL